LREEKRNKTMVEIVIAIITTAGAVIVAYWQYNKIKKNDKEESGYGCPNFKLSDTSTMSDLFRMKYNIINNFKLSPEVYVRPNLKNIENLFKNMLYNKVCIFIDVAKTIINKYDNCEGTNCPHTVDEAYRYIEKEFNLGLTKFNNYYKVCPNLSEKQRDALKIAIPLLNAIHQKNINMFRNSFDRYLKSAHLTGDCAKTFVNQVMNLYVVGIQEIWSDVHDAMYLINGELANVQFENMEYEF